jgi:excisionase family DNA binding protein
MMGEVCPMSQQFYTVRQTAEILNVSYMMAFRKVTEKEFPSIRMGRKILVPAAFIDRLITQAMTNAPAEA